MKTGAKVLIGCLAAPFVLVLLLALSVLSMKLVPMEASRPEAARLEQPLPETSTLVTEEQLAAEGLVAAAAAPAGPVLTVQMHLEEGAFTIVPAPAGTPIKVEGDYDSGAYELIQKMEGVGTDAPVYTLTFRPKYTMLRRLLSQGFVELEDGMNPLKIHLPKGVPMKLNARILKCESDIDLGGLALSGATLDLSMGEHEVRASRPNPIEMGELVITMGMGEFRTGSLGNLRAGSITFHGKMGENDIDLGSRLLRDTKVYARMRMGEMRVGLPSNAKIKSRSSVFMGDSRGMPEGGWVREEGEPEPEFSLDVDASATMGELRFEKIPPDDREL